MANWANLPRLALNLISKFLPFAADYIRFRSVCSSWRSSAPKRPIPPILAGHRLDDDRSLKIFNFFSFDGCQIIPIDDYRLPELPLDGFCCGSSHGWMDFLDRSEGITLWNPVTRYHIQLPAINHYPDCRGHKVSKVGDKFIVTRMSNSKETYVKSFEEMKSYLASKVVLSSDPSSDSNCVALLIHSRWGRLAFCRLGDDVWSTVQVPELSSSHTDAMFYKGKFYILCYLAIYVLNLGQEPAFKRVLLANPTFVGEPSLEIIHECYLVESAGDLLLVNVCDSGGEGFGVDDDRVYWFEVYKIDWGMHRVKLLKLKSLDDQALFLGRNQSVSLSASKFFGCRANCIYMAEYLKEKAKIRVYNLADGSNDFISNSAAQHSSGWGPCAWVMPSLL